MTKTRRRNGYYAIQELLKTVVQEVMETALPKTAEWGEVIKAIQAASDVDFTSLYDEKADPKTRATASADLTKEIQDVAGELAAVVQCVEAVNGELSKMKPDDPTKTIGDLSNDSEQNDGDFPTPDDIASAVEKSYVVPDWFNKAWGTGSKEAEKESGGFFKKVAGFLAKLFGGDDSGNIVSDDAMVAAIMSSPFEEFVAINVQGVQKSLVGTTEDIGTETAEASAAAAAAQAGDKAAASDKVDAKAAAAGVEALKSDKDTAQEVGASVKDALEPGDFAAFQTAMDGKLDALAARQQEIISKILALYASGPDGATPEKAAEVADAAEDAADSAVASSFKNLDALADLGDKHLGDTGGELVKTMLSDDEASKLFAAHRLRPGARLHESTLRSLLFEQEEDAIAIEDVVTAFAAVGKAIGQAPDESAVSAWAADVNDQELLDKKIAVTSGEGEEGEEAPLDDAAAAEEQDAAEQELQGAAQDAAGDADAPGVAITTALDNWAAALSPTSQSSLTSKKRLDGLKDLVNQALGNAASAIEKEVAGAVASWRGEHEETLIKSKRFAKKNFDALEKIIPAIASAMLKKTSENNLRLTRGMVRKSVHKYLDTKFGRSGVLLESARWEVLAGVRKTQ